MFTDDSRKKRPEKTTQERGTGRYCHERKANISVSWQSKRERERVYWIPSYRPAVTKPNQTNRHAKPTKTGEDHNPDREKPRSGASSSCTAHHAHIRPTSGRDRHPRQKTQSGGRI